MDNAQGQAKIEALLQQINGLEEKEALQNSGDMDPWCFRSFKLHSKGCFSVVLGFAAILMATSGLGVFRGLSCILAIAALISSLVANLILNDIYDAIDRFKVPKDNAVLWLMRKTVALQLCLNAKTRCWLGFWLALVAGVLPFAMDWALWELFRELRMSFSTFR